MTSDISCYENHIQAALQQKESILVTVCEITTSSQAAMESPKTSRPSSQQTANMIPKRTLTGRYSMASQQSFPPTTPTAIHPALRPISVFSRSSSSSSTSTTGYAYDSMSVGSEPSTRWTIGSDYNSMRPGILPNSDFTTGLSYEEMRGASVASPITKTVKQRWLRAYKEELKGNFKAMDRAFWG